MTVLLLLYVLGQQATDAQAGALENPRWILTRDEFRTGEVVEGWIVFPPPESDPVATESKQGLDQSVTSVVLETPSEVDAWFAPDQKNCQSDQVSTPDPTPESRQQWEGRIPADGRLLKVCARTPDDRSFIIAAVIRQDGKVHVVPSDKVSIQDNLKLDPALLGILTTAIGFLTGLIGYVGQKFFDRWLSLRDTRKAIVRTVTEMLAKEIGENREKLSRYIEGKELDPPTLEMGQYVALLGDEGAMSFLNSEERKDYFPKIERLYSSIGDFNDAVNNLVVMPETAEAVLKEAKALRQRLGNVAGTT